MDNTTTDAVALPDVAMMVAQTDFRKVLVVDDDPSMRRIMGKTLVSAGYDVMYAVNGAEAMELVRQESPNFVITDWDMPILDGAEFCRQVRGQDLPYYVYIVMLTGTHVTRLVEGLAAGADDFITKPLRAAELLARMQAGARVLQLEENLRLLASHDALTELMNRRTFFSLFETEWARAGRIGYPLSCAMIDVDHFKNINDLHGHLAGDDVLRAVSRAMEQSCRKTDSVGRYGGEEFSALLPNADEQGAAVWAENCRKAVADTPIVVNETNVHVTVSVGVAQKHKQTRSPQELLDLADRALLAAKQQGRNRVVVQSSLPFAGLQAAKPCSGTGERNAC